MVAGRMWNSAGAPTALRQQLVLSLIAVFIAGELCAACCFHRRCAAPTEGAVASPLRAIERRHHEGAEGGGLEGVSNG